MTNASSQLTEGKMLKSADGNLGAHALANSPEIMLAKSMTGPSRTIKLFRILGLMNSLLGNVTPEDSIWMPNTILVN